MRRKVTASLMAMHWKHPWMWNGLLMSSRISASDVIPNKRIGDPRVETATDIITMGLDGSLDDAFKEATSDGSKKTTS